MTKRARGVRVVEPEIPRAQPLGLSGVAAQMAALEPPKTNAHETSAPTPCRCCGGGCEPSERRWGPWRQHGRCGSVAGDPIGRLMAAAKALGHPLSRPDAALVPFSVPTYAQTHTEPCWTAEPLKDRLPWRHLDRPGLYAALERLPGLRIEAGVIETRCTDGPCCWCGVLEARGWSSYGHRWADGSEAPLCGPCSVIYERTGEPSPAYWPEQRAGIAEAATGVPIGLGESAPDGLLAYAETESNSDGEPWSHLPTAALERFRWTAWAHWGGKYAPPEHRAEALARAAQADAAKAARHAAILAEERARLDTYGFGVA